MSSDDSERRDGSERSPRRWDRLQQLLRWHALSLLVVLVVATYYVLKWRTLSGFVEAIDLHPQFMQDFVGHYYPMGRQIMDVPVPVIGYMYTTFFAILMVPVSAMDLSSAMVVWGALQLVALVLLCVVTARGLLHLSALGTAGAVGLVLTSIPVLSNVKWGQVSIPITALMIGAVWSQRQKRSVLAGVLLAFAAAIKLYPVVFVFYFVLQRDVRAIVAFAIAGIVCYVLLPASLLGFDNWFEFEAATAAGAGNISVAANVNSQYFANVGLRWFYLSFDRQADELLIRVLGVVGYAVGLLCLALAVVFQRRAAARSYGLPVVAGFLALPFLIKTSWPHYFVYLPLCQVVTMAFLMACARNDGLDAKTRRLAKVLSLFPFVSMLLSSIFFFDLCGHWGNYGIYGVLFVADLLLLIAVAIVAVRRLEAPALQPASCRA